MVEAVGIEPAQEGKMPDHGKPPKTKKTIRNQRVKLVLGWHIGCR